MPRRSAPGHGHHPDTRGGASARTPARAARSRGTFGHHALHARRQPTVFGFTHTILEARARSRRGPEPRRGRNPAVAGFSLWPESRRGRNPAVIMTLLLLSRPQSHDHDRVGASVGRVAAPRPASAGRGL